MINQVIKYQLYIRIYSHAHTHTFAVYVPYICIYVYACAYTHKSTRRHTQTNRVSLTFSLSLSLSISLPLSHSHILTYTKRTTHTHAHTHKHPHTDSLEDPIEEDADTGHDQRGHHIRREGSHDPCAQVCRNVKRGPEIDLLRSKRDLQILAYRTEQDRG
jgi:hypothetical protein